MRPLCNANFIFHTDVTFEFEIEFERNVHSVNNVCIPTRGVLLLCCHVQYMVCSVLIPAWTAVQGRHKHMCMDRGYLTLGFVDCGRLRLRMDPHKGEVSVDICSMRILSIHQSADTGYLHFLVYVSCLRIPVVSMRRSALRRSDLGRPRGK